VSPENSFLLKCTLSCENYERLLRIVAHKYLLRLTCILERITVFWGSHVFPKNSFLLRFARVSWESVSSENCCTQCVLRITRCLERISVFWGSHVSPANSFLVKCTWSCERYECLLRIVAHKCMLRIVAHKCLLRIAHCLLRITIFWGSHESPEKCFLLRFARVSWELRASSANCCAQVSLGNYTLSRENFSVFWGSHVSPENSFLLKCTWSCENYDVCWKMSHTSVFWEHFYKSVFWEFHIVSW